MGLEVALGSFIRILVSFFEVIFPDDVAGLYYSALLIAVALAVKRIIF